MGRLHTNRNVLEAAVDRIEKTYRQGHRLIIAFSGGKDSGVLLELAILAAKRANRLPVEAIFRDDEIYYPGTAAYVQRTMHRPEVQLYWVSARQASANVYNRTMPFFWVFDQRLPPNEWVRTPPPEIMWWDHNYNLYTLINTLQFPPPPKKRLCAVIGIRTTESNQRLNAIHSAKGARSFSSDDSRLFNLYPILIVTGKL